MTLRDFLKDSILEFPTNQTKATYLDTINDKFATYIAKIGSLDDNEQTAIVKHNIPKIKILCDKLLQAVEEYLNGNSYKSFERFCEGLQAVDTFFRTFYSIQQDPDEDRDYLKRLYRVRTSETILSDKALMFHIPFESRHLVKTQRYSIPGIPCLYFGSSAFIAWKELGQPNVGSVYISRFETTKTIRVLNFNYNHEWIRSIYFDQFAPNVPALIDMPVNLAKIMRNGLVDLIEAWFVMFPVMLAASIRRKNPGTSFCDAYIIPQHVMQFIKNDKDHKIDGVRYISTKFNNEIRSFSIPICWAFPIKKSLPQGHCSELKQMFALTPIQAWQFLDFSGAGNPNGISSNDIEYMPGSKKAYINTIWGVSELQLAIAPAVVLP